MEAKHQDLALAIVEGLAKFKSVNLTVVAYARSGVEIGYTFEALAFLKAMVLKADHVTLWGSGDEQTLVSVPVASIAFMHVVAVYAQAVAR